MTIQSIALVLTCAVALLIIGAVVVAVLWYASLPLRRMHP
jgi:hypothetical protein